MTFREDFPMFWLGVLGVLACCALLCNQTRRTFDDFTWLGTVSATVYVGLYALLNGLP